MAGRSGGAYVNGRYVAGGGRGGGGGKGAGANSGKGARTSGWSNEGGGDKWERKPGDEDVNLERKFDIDILQPGEGRVGYLFNMKPTRHYDEGGRTLAGLVLYFLQRDGRTFRCTFLYRPYFFVHLGNRDGLEQMRDILAQRFENEGVHVEIVEKEDLSMEDHIIGRRRKLIKLSFGSTEGHSKARINLQQELKRQKKTDGFAFESPDKKEVTSAMDSIEGLNEYDVDYVNRVCIDNVINCGKWFQVTRNLMATSVDNIYDTQSTVTALNEMLYKPGLRIFAWDIECTKEPLKFPDSAYDRITMISIMVDGSGFLIVNRTEVSADIEPLEYTPKPEYEGVFQTYNEPDEAALLRRFFALIRETSPHVIVSFNGDFFDFPFVTQRSKVYNLDWLSENGIQKNQNGDCYAGQWMVHLDCFAWVQRDSYLPCGARGLKAVTRYKLKYDPVELDPEDMTPFAKERPQELAAYSVSDAVATYYLYQKYIHDFIFALCTIIPYGPDDVLRKGSGTLCESLLMNQAFHAQVLFPNKHMDAALEYHDGTNRLIEQSTYEGARVECMRVGIYRADIKETFQLEPSAFQTLLNDLKKTIDFFLVVEEKVKLEDVENYEEILTLIEKTLRSLCDPDRVAAQVGRQSQSSPLKPTSAGTQSEDYTLKLVEYEVIEGKGGVKSGGKKVKKATYRVIKDDFPLIYHLDVGAMYPNIILSNRLQPAAIVSKEFCNACSYNDPSNRCKKDMDWKWRGELYMATRADVRSIMNEMENDKRRYNQKDRDSGEVKRVKWSELRESEQTAEIIKAVREFSQKAYRRVKSSIYEDKTDTVCQRENPFYVDTVRNFRDRRYMFKALTKEWTKKVEKAEESDDPVKKMEAKDMVLLYDSLQLAHKCILNSFYGYVMRKGARWHSMKMAGIVTYTGSNLIREAREFCDMVGLPIELDTDGIWCMLPKSFPDTYKFRLKGGKELKMPYPNCVLNYRVHQKYTNHQYQMRSETGEWKTTPENSIFFEIDGPYKAMILPASTEEDKMLKKRYAVFNFDGSMAELKGFEVKRRGELRLIQVFQTEVFPEFLKGASKQEVYTIIGNMANRWLDVIESRGRTMSDEEVIYFFSESKSMSKSVEASGNGKSVQITTARRLAEFLGVDSYLNAEGISCHMFIANKPHNASVTERAVPVKIFSAEYEVKKRWLQKWLQDSSLNEFDMRTVIDWNYYRERLCAVFQKLISIPAAYQGVSNPCPRVQVPEWLRKRVAEQNDKFQQRSLGLWLRKAGPAEGVAAMNGKESALEGGKRKLCDMEDLAGARPGGGPGLDLPLVDFGAGPKQWLEVQRSRWATSHQLDAANAPSRAGLRMSLFDDSAVWASVPSEALASSWQIVAIEPAHALRGSSGLRIGDSIFAAADVDADDLDGGPGSAEEQRGRVTGFVGGLVRIALEAGGERLFKQDAVRRAKDEGLFALWVAIGPGLALHRCEVLAQRRVIIALETEFSPEGARCEVRPNDLSNGLQVWPREPTDTRVGPGIITSTASDIGLCSVTWATERVEVACCQDLERQCGGAAKVLRDPPRNLQHSCLLELRLEEGTFQKQRGEGFLGDGDSTWPRIDSVYEAEQPLDFDLICRLGPIVKLKAQEKAEEARRRGVYRFHADDLMQAPHKEYLLGLVPTRNVYLHLCFDRAHPSRAFCGVFAPTLAEAWACYGGLDTTEGDSMRPDLEQSLSENLAQLGGSSPMVRAEIFFVTGKSLNAIMQWVDQRLQEVRRRDGGSVCVLCSQLSIGELRGLAPSFWVDQRHTKHLTALREMPVCPAPFVESDSHFPALDWPRWISRRFAGKVPQLYGWWRQRLALCRAAGLPICNAPEMPAAMVPAALDVFYSRQLERDSQLRWASPTSRPDLGETSLALIDAQEGSIAAMNWVFHGKDLSAGRGGGQINRPGVYRSICLEVNLKTRLCICALQHARHLSDMEGGELSKKMIRKAAPGGDLLKNLDHTSEASVSSFESLVTMVQEISATCAAKEKEIVALRHAWVAQSASAKAALTEAGVRLDVAAEDDGPFLETMARVGQDDAQLAAKLEELRTEHDAYSKLLEGLYGWLASDTSLLHDAALLRKVHQYMDRALQVLMSVLKRNGCSVIHASYTKIIFATGKFRVFPDIRVFWEALCTNVQAAKPLEPLALSDASCLAELHYGMLWLDPANWAAVPIDQSTGDVIWKANHYWKIADFLPPAVRPSLILYASDLLLGPQCELGRRYGGAMLNTAADDAEDVAPAGNDEAMDIDGFGPDADDHGEEMAGCDDDAPEAGLGDGVGAAAAPDAKQDVPGAPAEGQAAGGGASEAATKSAEVSDELRTFMQGAFFEDLRRRVIRYVGEIQAQQQHELPNGVMAETTRLAVPGAEGHSESSGEEDCEASGHRAQERRAERQRRHMQEKWHFPEVAGRRAAPGSVEMEFMRVLIQIFMLEESLTDQVLALRDRLCQKLRVSSFGAAAGVFENPCFPLILRDVICPWCCVASHVDVTSHPTKGPGLWVCVNCERLYNKDTVQALLVGLLENVVQAWQSQEITCQKCRRLRTAHIQTFCDCFGRFEVRFKSTDFKMVLLVLRSLIAPHDLPWLGEMVGLYECMVL